MLLEGKKLLITGVLMDSSIAFHVAKIAQEQFLVQLRPVLTTSRREDPTLKVNFGDAKWVHIPGAGAVAEVSPGEGSMGPETPVVYLAVALRNAGNGIAVLHGWRFFPDWHRDQEHAPLEEFERQNRDLYIPVGDVGFWQGALREPDDPVRLAMVEVIEARRTYTIDVLYSDHEGGQRAMTRFLVTPAGDDTWMGSVGRQSNVDRDDPR